MNKLPMIECKDVESELQPGPHSEVLAVDTGVEGRKPETEVFEVGVERKSDLWRILIGARVVDRDSRD